MICNHCGKKIKNGDNKMSVIWGPANNDYDLCYDCYIKFRLWEHLKELEFFKERSEENG